LSAVQSSDAGKAYHSGIRLVLKLLGKPVPGVPTNTREAKDVLAFVDDVIQTMREHPDWFVCAPVLPQCVASVCIAGFRHAAPPRRLELYRLERRFCNTTYSQAVQLVRSHNALGLDRFLRHVAPKTDLGFSEPDLHKRNALVRRALRLAALRSAPRLLRRAPAQFYSTAVSEYLDAAQHMLEAVRPLAERGRALEKWEQLIFRDLLAAVMCAPSQKKKGMRPTRSFKAQLVRHPEDRTRDVCVALSHNQLWWSAPFRLWRRRARNYLEPERVARHNLWGDSFRAAEAEEDAAADAAGAAASRSRSAARKRRFERERAMVRASLHPPPPFRRRSAYPSSRVPRSHGPLRAQYNREELSEVPAEELLLWIELNAKITQSRTSGKFMYYVTKKGAIAHGRRRNRGNARSHLCTLCVRVLLLRTVHIGLLAAGGWSDAYTTKRALWRAIRDKCGPGARASRRVCSVARRSARARMQRLGPWSSCVTSRRTPATVSTCRGRSCRCRPGCTAPPAAHASLL
jgi:hypothetical protein